MSDKVKKIFEMQRQGYVVNEDNYEEMLKAFSVLEANKVGVKQLPEPPAKKTSSTAKKPAEDSTHFPEYTGAVRQATVVATSSKVKRLDQDTVEIQDILLDVRYAQDSNQITLTCDPGVLLQAGITVDRRNEFSKSVDNFKMLPTLKSGIEKIALSLKDGTKQPRYKRGAVVGTVVFKNKNCGTKRQWNMYSISNLKLDPASVISAAVKPIAAPAPVVVPTSVAAQVVTGLTNLVGFSSVISKTDPLLVNDPWLITNGYSPSIDITSKNQEDLRNRVVEILVHRQFPTLNWVNQQTEKFLTYDFEELANKQTIDIKTICDREHNLLIKRKAKENATLADALGLVLVEDMGVNFRIECFGFISRVHILRYIEGMPTCFMKQFDSYKIDKKILLRFPFSW